MQVRRLFCSATVCVCVWVCVLWMDGCVGGWVRNSFAAVCIFTRVHGEAALLARSACPSLPCSQCSRHTAAPCNAAQFESAAVPLLVDAVSAVADTASSRTQVCLCICVCSSLHPTGTCTASRTCSHSRKLARIHIRNTYTTRTRTHTHTHIHTHRRSTGNFGRCQPVLSTLLS